MMKENKLWKKINERDNLIESKEKEYGETFPSMFNYPEIREWYTEVISPLDEEILKIANQVLSYYKKDSLKDIKSVYADEFLFKLHQTSKNKRR